MMMNQVVEGLVIGLLCVCSFWAGMNVQEQNQS